MKFQNAETCALCSLALGKRYMRPRHHCRLPGAEKRKPGGFGLLECFLVMSGMGSGISYSRLIWMDRGRSYRQVVTHVHHKLKG